MYRLVNLFRLDTMRVAGLIFIVLTGVLFLKKIFVKIGSIVKSQPEQEFYEITPLSFCKDSPVTFDAYFLH